MPPQLEYRCRIMLEILSLTFIVNANRTRLSEGKFLYHRNMRPINCQRVAFGSTLAARLRECMNLRLGTSNYGCGFVAIDHPNSAWELCETNTELQTFNGWSTWEFTEVNGFSDCAESYHAGMTSSGVYNIYPRDGGHKVSVFCDMDTDGGGWTVIQKRYDGSQDFKLTWAEYKEGFGSPYREYWLGNDNIHDIVNGKTIYELRVDLEDFSNISVFAQYSTFQLSDERDKYKLTLGSYNINSTAGDSLSQHDRGYFSTTDVDNDAAVNASCAVRFKGAWWYKSCHSSNLNGLYLGGKHASYADGIEWYTFRGHYYSVKRSEMKIRPASFFEG